ncbi:MAG: nucleotide-binding protein [Bryobacterales bacterium]|nr:nucleotide-binding protein [Bryobacterales bacterium]
MPPKKRGAAVAKNPVPYVFIASSSATAARECGEHLAAQLQEVAEAVFWKHDVFLPGQHLLESLSLAIDRADFAVLLCLPEGKTNYRSKKYAGLNPNVLFELGVSLGRLGKSRAFVVRPQGANLLAPGYLDGISQVEFIMREESTAASTMGPVCLKIKEAMKLQGLKERGGAEAKESTAAGSLTKVRQAKLPIVSAREFRMMGRIEANGDLTFTEEYEDVRPFGKDPLPRWDWTIRSHAGKPDEPVIVSRTPGQQVRWEHDARPAGTDYKGWIVFDPPLIANDKVSFSMSRITHNAVYFSKKDAQLAGNREPEREFVSKTMLQDWESLFLQLQFPPSRFPSDCRPFVTKAGKPQPDELERAQPHFRANELSSLVTLSVSKPVAGMTYGLEWSLPEEDEQIPRFSDDVMGYVEELTRRLIFSSVSPSCSTREITPSLQRMLPEIAKGLGLAAAAADDLELTLFLFDRLAGCLRCAGTTSAAAEKAGIWKLQLKPGRGLPGKAFRSRVDVLYANLPGCTKRNVAVYELLPEETKPPVTVIWCHPIRFGDEQDRSIAVLALNAVRRKDEFHDLLVRPEYTEKLGAICNRMYREMLTRYARVNTSTFWKVTGGRTRKSLKATSGRGAGRG